MTSPQFRPYDLQLLQPDFDSHLTDLILELNHLRKKIPVGSTHPALFFQIKSIFHLLESLGSARIEGNHTTLSQAIENRLTPPEKKDEQYLQISNLETAMAFVDEHIDELRINHVFIRELHQHVVAGLSTEDEGSLTPGAYRNVNLVITRSNHVPPDHVQIHAYMEELLQFADAEDAQKYDLLKIAIAHHRLTWIHPFDNGNGRTVRLVTYAMLAKQGFNVHVGRIINPTAVFCSDRDAYYAMLARADSGRREDVLAWCEYVLGGLTKEIEKIDRLLNHEYLAETILLPAISHSLDRKLITLDESKILTIAAREQVLQAADIKPLFPGKVPSEISRVIANLRNKRMIQPEAESKRKYVLCFSNSYLLRGIIKALDENGFLPIKNDEL